MTEPSHTNPSRAAFWLREPLLHFLVAGAALFAIDAVVAARSEDPTRITLDAAVDAELRQLFEDERGRAPTAAELEPLRARWLDNELLYREGLALGLDRGDSGIRERVIFKALNVVQANLQLAEPDEPTLRAWFEMQRSRYDDPPRIDFLEAVTEGKPARGEVLAFAEALNAGRADTARSGLRVYKGRPLATLPETFGAAFTERLLALPIGQWQVLDSADGPRAVRLDARRPGTPAVFESVRSTVLADWRDRRMAELRTEAVRALGEKYTLRVTAQAPR